MPAPFKGAKIHNAPRNYDSDFTPMAQDEQGLDVAQTQEAEITAESGAIPAAPTLMRVTAIKLTNTPFYALNGGAGYTFNQTTMNEVVPLIKEEILQYASRSFMDAREAVKVAIVGGKLQIKAIGSSLLEFESVQIDGATIAFA